MEAPENKKRNGTPKAETVELAFELSNPAVMPQLVGEHDQNLKILERTLDVSIGRGSEGLIVQGQDAQVDLACDLLDQLSGLLEQGETIWPGDVERAVQMLSKDRKARLEDLFREQVRIAGRKRTIVPKTFAQKRYMDAMRAHDLVFGVGPAGTGKTYLAMAMAVQALIKKDVKRVVLCRPAVEAGEKLGFLPGDMAEKVNPYLRPLYDALHDMVEFDRADEMVEKGMIEVAPLAFMRGRTLADAFVILDEAQNTTEVQMKMLLTRLGRNSKCVITGDITQIDLPRGQSSGMIQALRILRDVPKIAISPFSEEDVIRHPLVSAIIGIYTKAEAGGES
ncbi:MAG: PhoH family protein [Bdellovibrionota bacterium]